MREADPVRTLSTIEISQPEAALQAAEHLRNVLAERFDCSAWAEGSRITVALDLGATLTSQRMAAWRRIVAEALAEIDVSVTTYE
jgi:hypothetical protein